MKKILTLLMVVKPKFGETFLSLSTVILTSDITG